MIYQQITKEKQRLFDYLYKVVNSFNKKPNINLVRQQIKEVNLIPGNSYPIKDTLTYKEELQIKEVKTVDNTDPRWDKLKNLITEKNT